MFLVIIASQLYSALWTPMPKVLNFAGIWFPRCLGVSRAARAAIADSNVISQKSCHICLAIRSASYIFKHSAKVNFYRSNAIFLAHKCDNQCIFIVHGYGNVNNVTTIIINNWGTARAVKISNDPHTT